MPNTNPYTIRLFRNQPPEFPPFVTHALTNAIREIGPFRQQQLQLQQLQNASAEAPAQPEAGSNNVVIDMEMATAAEPLANDFLNNPANNPNPEEPLLQQEIPIQPEWLAGVFMNYVPFVLILLGKALYDYHQGIFLLAILIFIFCHSNCVVRTEAGKRHKRSLKALTLQLIYILACLVFIQYAFEGELHNFSVVVNMVMIRTFNESLTVWNLLWIVIITDFILKLTTVCVKILLTMLPGRIIDFKKRGKVYMFIEAVSQLYRSLATVQPWMFFLLDAYSKSEWVVTMFLFTFYLICKGSDFLTKNMFLKTAFLKLLQNVTIGSSPSKDQIRSAGDHCPICHDEYDTPVLLQCRHIFCETCVSTWFDREPTCPLCRAKIVDDPAWRDGSTTHFIQMY